MNLKNKRPVFVPREYQAEMEELSKAALMDLVWDLLAMRHGERNHGDIMSEFRQQAEIVLTHRNKGRR
jgi:hypothetical protein